MFRLPPHDPFDVTYALVAFQTKSHTTDGRKQRKNGHFIPAAMHFLLMPKRIFGVNPIAISSVGEREQQEANVVGSSSSSFEELPLTPDFWFSISKTPKGKERPEKKGLFWSCS